MWALVEQIEDLGFGLRALELGNGLNRAVLERQHADYLLQEDLSGKRQEAGDWGRVLSQHLYTLYSGPDTILITLQIAKPCKSLP